VTSRWQTSSSPSQRTRSSGRPRRISSRNLTKKLVIKTFHNFLDRKNFQYGQSGYPIFSHAPLDLKPFTFYGEIRKQNEDNIIDDQEMKQEVAEVQQAITAVKKEERQRETYNRFKEYAITFIIYIVFRDASQSSSYTIGTLTMGSPLRSLCCAALATYHSKRGWTECHLS
jgi:hypothetical protein